MQPESQKISVLIVDDEAAARQKLKIFLAEETDIEIVGEADNGVDALTQIAELAPDLVLLDIQMPKLDGLAVASNLEDNPDINIVFITGFNEYAVKAFELNAVDYLLKPYDKGRFKKTLERVREQTSNQAQHRPYSIPQLIQDYRSEQTYPAQLLFKTDTALEVTNAADIEWLEASGNYVKVCLSNNAFVTRQTLTAVQSQLDPRQFIRIHRSHVVNIRQITQVLPLTKGDHNLRLNSGTELRLSRSYQSDFFALFGQ